MVSIYNLKPAFQNLIRPTSNWLAKHKFTPNQITIAAFIISLLNGLAIACYPDAHWPLLLVPMTLFLRMVLNAIDGMLAREYAMQSALGAFLNEIGDVLSDAFLYLPFCFIEGSSPILITLIVILAIIAEMTGVVAIQVGSKRRYDGPMGKSDRAFVFGTIGFFLGLGFSITNWLNVLLSIVFILVVITMINRMHNALREIA